MISKGDVIHIDSDSIKEYTEFENGTYVVLEPATSKPKIGYNHAVLAHL